MMRLLGTLKRTRLPVSELEMNHQKHSQFVIINWKELLNNLQDESVLASLKNDIIEHF